MVFLKGKYPQMSPTTSQSVGPPHVLHRLYTAQLEWVPGTRPRCSAQPARTAREPCVTAPAANSLQAKLTRLGQWLFGWRIPKKQQYLWEAGTTWGVKGGADMRQKLFLSTCWSFKTQWHFFTWATCFKVSFLAKFTLNSASQTYFLVLAVRSHYLGPDPHWHCVSTERSARLLNLTWKDSTATPVCDSAQPTRS